jgi:hypothetical protein
MSLRPQICLGYYPDYHPIPRTPLYLPLLFTILDLSIEMGKGDVPIQKEKPS